MSKKKSPQPSAEELDRQANLAAARAGQLRIDLIISGEVPMLLNGETHWVSLWDLKDMLADERLS